MHRGDRDIQLPAQMLLRLQGIYRSLKRAERSAADLLIHRPGFVARSTIAAASEDIGISQPTFVRLAQRLGFSGYAEMKEVLLASDAPPAQPRETPYAHLRKESPALDIAQSIVHASIQALSDLLCVMNPEDYERAAAALIGAERIAFFGSGDSGVVALSAFQKFVKVGAICHTTSDGDTQLMLAALMNEKCACVLVSHSGDTVSMVQAAKLAKAAGATTIAVTNFPYSHLAKQCDIVLLTATFVECGGELVTQRIAQLAIIESLFIIYRMRKSAQCDKALAHVDKVIDETKRS